MRVNYYLSFRRRGVGQLRLSSRPLATGIAALLAGLALHLPSDVSAADITWGAATTVSANADISRDGFLFGAYNLGSTGAGSPVLNGVTFTEFAVGSTPTATLGNFTLTASSGNLISSNALGGGTTPPFNGLSPAYKTLLGSAAGGGTFGAPVTLTMSGLVAGQSYEFQWWANDSWTNFATRGTTATAGNSVTLQWENTGVIGGIGQYAIGNFVADSATQAITFSIPSNQVVINAFQLRVLSAPVAYWTGDQSNTWNTSNGGNTNWATDATGATDTGTPPLSMTDVFFSASGAANQSTLLGQNFTINSLTVDDPAAVTIGGAKTLTIAADAAITVNAGAGLFTIGSGTTLALTGTTPTITVNNDAGAIIRGVITGSNGLVKDGTGELTLANDNTYTGGTTIKSGMLSIGNHSSTGSILGDVEVDAGAVFALDRTNSYTYSGTISGDGEVRMLGTGTTTLTAASSTYGSLTVRAGTVVLDGGDTTLTSTANRPLFIGRDTDDTPQLFIQNGATLVANQGAVSTTLVTGASGTGVTVDGHDSLLETGTQLVIGRNDFAAPHNFGFVTVQNFATLTNDGNIIVGDEGGNGTFTVQTSGQVNTNGAAIIGLCNGSVGLATVTGAGSSWTIGQDLRLGGFDAGDFGGTATLNILDGGSVSVTGRTKLWTDGSSITANGGTFSTGSLTNLTGTTPTIAISDAKLGTSALQVGSDNTSSFFSGQIVDAAGGPGSVLKTGLGVLTLQGASTYTGGTTIAGGAILANNTSGSATGTGPVDILSGATLGGRGTAGGAVTLESGAFIAPGASLSHIATATLKAGSLLWNGGGQLNMELGTTSDLLALTGALGKGTPGTYVVDVEDAGGIGSQSHYQLVTFGLNKGFTAGDFTLASTIPGLTATLTLTGSELDLDIIGLTMSGPIIQNSAPIGTPTFADFIVNGAVTTGNPTENNVIHTLSFAPGGSLLIHNTLFVTQGPVILPGGSTITLDGSLSVSELQMLFGSLLNGNGSILGNLINGGLISPGHSPGQIHLSGNYVQPAGGTLRIEIAGRDLSQHDLFSVGGSATLGGTLQIVPLDGFKLKRNKPVTFLTADGGVNGKFTNIESGFTSDTILEPTVVYHSNSVDFEAVQGSFEKFADRTDLTPNQKSVARALDSLPINRKTNSLFDFLDYRQLNELPRDFDKIAPEELTSMFTIGVSLANVQSGNIQRRTDDIRSGSGGFSAAGLAINGAGPSYSGSFFNNGVAGPSGDDGKENKTLQQVVPAESRWGAFLSGTGEWVSVGNTENARGYTIDSGGFTLGLDYKVTPNLAIGVAAGYTGTTADLTEGGRVYVNGGKIGLYATYYEYQQVKATPTMSKDASKEGLTPTYAEARGFYADAAVFGGYNSYHTHRAALQDDATGDTDGGELNVLFGGGYDFKKGNFTFGPTASFNYTYLGTNAFTEHGSLAPLDIHGGKGESLRSAFGLKASYDWKVGGILIKPEIRAAWQHEFGDNVYSLDSSFANGGGDTFRVDGPQLGRDSVLLGAGFAIQFNDRFSTYFYYDGDLGRKNYQSTSVTGGFRLSF